MCTYIKCLSHGGGSLSRPPPEYSPCSEFLALDSSAWLAAPHSCSDCNNTPIPMKSTPAHQEYTKTNMQSEANHDVWQILAKEGVKDCIPLFHIDPSYPTGCGPEHNWPGVHCLIQQATDSLGGVHKQMTVFYKCSLTDALLIKAKLTSDYNGTIV